MAFKSIIDPVHGSIRLNELEADIVSSQTFQRLHSIRQLGLAHYVFPSANYSRFAHSVGACHNAQQIIGATKNNGGAVGEDATRLCRLAALLHDIGHYPFSHATEHVVKAFYGKNLLQGATAPMLGVTAVPAAPVSVIDGETAPYLNHELVGRKLIEHDPILRAVFSKHGFSTEELKHVFSKERPFPLIGVISSDLDCDRLDYLRRTAHTSGLPYGMVDIDYIIGQARLDQDGRYSFGKKALRAADHLLVSRYYDYLQVPFHKTVVALEWSLVKCMEEVMARGLEDLSTSGVIKKIQTGEWARFDDAAMVGHFRNMYDELPKTEESVLKSHLRAVLERRAPKVVCGVEAVANRGASKHAPTRTAIKSVVRDVANKLKISGDYLHVWDHRLDITKAYSKGDEDSDGSVFICNEGGAPSKPLTQFPQALMNTLGTYEYSGIRVYLLDHEARFGEIKSALISAIKNEIPEFGLEFSVASD